MCLVVVYFDRWTGFLVKLCTYLPTAGVLDNETGVLDTCTISLKLGRVSIYLHIICAEISKHARNRRFG